MHLKYVEIYKNEGAWNTIGAVSQDEIKNHIAPLITSYGDDELAKRFDIVVYTISLAYLQNNNATKGIKNVISTAEKLSKLGTIPEVVEKKHMIEKERVY